MIAMIIGAAVLVCLCAGISFFAASSSGLVRVSLSGRSTPVLFSTPRADSTLIGGQTFRVFGNPKGLAPTYESGIRSNPYFSVAELEQWIIALEKRGTTLAHFHLDVDIERVRVDRSNVKADLQALSQFLKQRGIPFGVIFTSNWHAAYSDRAYFDSTMEWVRTVNDAIGKPQHVIFQSWQAAPADRDHKGVHEVPINLPENDPAIYSHTRLLLEGLGVFDR